MERFNPLPAAFKQLHMIVAQQRADQGGAENGEVFWRHNQMALGMYTLTHHLHADKEKQGHQGFALKMWGRSCFRLMRDRHTTFPMPKKVLSKLAEFGKHRQELMLRRRFQGWILTVEEIMHQNSVINECLRFIGEGTLRRALEKWANEAMASVSRTQKNWVKSGEAKAWHSWHQRFQRMPEERKRLSGAMNRMRERQTSMAFEQWQSW